MDVHIFNWEAEARRSQRFSLSPTWRTEGDQASSQVQSRQEVARTAVKALEGWEEMKRDRLT